MGYYERAEQETLFNFDPINGNWLVYSTYPPDIRKILDRATTIINKLTDDDGRVVQVQAICEKSQIRLYK